MKIFSSLFIFILVAACATGENSGYRRSTEPEMQSNAEGAAYAAEGFTMNKRQKIRQKNVYEFYYKRCDLSDNLPYYSKTAYECSAVNW